MDGGVLAAGSKTRFSIALPLPQGMPPTHEIQPAYVRLVLRVHVSLPWRIDVRADFSLPVRVPPSEQVVRTPTALHSTRPTAEPDKPRLEVSLASSRLVAGEVMRGSVAVFHLDDRSPRDVELAIVPTLKLFGLVRTRERRGARLGSKLVLPPGSAGTGVPFELALPRSLTSSFTTTTHELSWSLVVTSGSFFGGKVELAVPLQIVDASAAATTERLPAAPRLGDERVASLFARFIAGGGWREVTPDDELAGDLAIAADRDDGSRLSISYAYRGEDGTFVMARIDYPSLGLDLAVVASSTLRHVFFEDLEVDVAAWDRAHHATARFAEQAIPVMRIAAPAMLRIASLGTLARWDDDALVYERGVSAFDEGDLAAIANELDELAGAITEARVLISPPPGVITELELWKQLASWLGAVLCVGDLSIDGTLDGVPVAVSLVWDEDKQPRHVRVAVGDPETAPEELRAISLSSRDQIAAHAQELAPRLAGWPTDFGKLAIADGIASSTLAVPVPPALEAERVRELVIELRAVIAALAPGAGPYR